MSILGGAECSTASNPLGQFMKHVHEESSLHQDRVAGRAVNNSPQDLRSDGVVGAQDLVCL